MGRGAILAKVVGFMLLFIDEENLYRLQKYIMINTLTASTLSSYRVPGKLLTIL